MQPINMIMIYNRDKRNGSHLEHVQQKCILCARDIKSIFLIVIISAYRTCYHFFIIFFFLVSCFNNESLSYLTAGEETTQNFMEMFSKLHLF